jgi:hypothetical protein
VSGKPKHPWAPPNPTALAALLASQNEGIPLNQPLISNQRLGSFWVAEISATPLGGSFAHELGRTPSAIIIVDNRTQNVIYRTDADVALATPSSIYLRSGPSATRALVLLG